MNEVEREFLESGKLRGSELFLPASEAIRMVRRYEELNADVLGVDAFILTKKTAAARRSASVPPPAS